MTVGVGLFLSAYVVKKYHRRALEYVCWKIGYYACNYRKKHRPHTLILVRHAESQANIDPLIYSRVPDNQIGLTERGIQQASELGKKLTKYVKKGDIVTFFVSQFERTRATAREIAKYFPGHKYFEDPRLREQEWGNLQHFQTREDLKTLVATERTKVGRFYYRFPEGESGSDVYDRVSLFFESLYRQMDNYGKEITENRVFIIVSHGTLLRMILMRYERMAIEDYHKMPNLHNTETLILKRYPDGRYLLSEKILPEEAIKKPGDQ